ncbi:MAG: cation:proton antiporter [Thermoleophilaceae bacterium]
MNAHDLIVSVLLFAGVALFVLSVLGVVVMRGVFDKLHFVPLASFGAVLVVAAIMVRQSFSLIGMKSMLTAAFLLVTGPVLAHATARSARVHEHGEWQAQPTEGVEVEEP